MKKNLITFFCVFFSAVVFSQEIDYANSVRFSAEDVGNGLLIKWIYEPEFNNYLISRRINGGTSFSFLSNVPGSQTSYLDTTVVPGTLYEYKVAKVSSSANIVGYMAGGIKVKPAEIARGVLILVKNNLIHELNSEINTFKEDLQNEKWYVEVEIINEAQSVQDIQSLIKLKAKNTPTITTVLLLGNIPVPYSGLIAPDGHPDHIGAWPCDAYYADLNGLWSDNTINNTAATGDRNDNVPGDGKFDQNSLNAVELEIGRIDLSDLPAFPLNEIELTRKYLIKNHAYRTQQTSMPYRGLIQNNFPGFGEAFGQSGVNNFSRMFGFDSVFYLPYKTTLQQEKYLWSYGCGPGSYTSAGGIGSTFELPGENHQTIFTMLFGSYFGDWDSQNNYLRAALASGNTLTNVWAGRPHWYFHHMAMGYPIGYSTKVTQNNAEFPTGVGPKSVHIALMGDPTLDMYPGFEAIEDVSYKIVENDIVFTIQKSSNISVDGYRVYLVYGDTSTGYHYLAQEVLNDTTTISIPCAELEYDTRYLITALDLVNTGSGSFYNESIGKSIVVTKSEKVLPSATFETEVYFDLVKGTITSDTATFNYWYIDSNHKLYDTLLNHVFFNHGVHQICLMTKNKCYSNVHCDTVSTTSSLPELEVVPTHPLCHDGFGRVELKVIKEHAPFEVIWSDDVTGLVYDSIPYPDYTYTIYTASGLIAAFGGSLEFPDPIVVEAEIQHEIENSDKGSIALHVVGGTAPYHYYWSNFDTLSKIENLLAGEYTVTITDANGCVNIQTVVVSFVTKNTEIAQAKFNLAEDGNTLKISCDEFGDCRIKQIELFDLNGRFIQQMVSTDNSKYWYANTSGIVSGIYIIRIQLNGKTKYIKWIKVKP